MTNKREYDDLQAKPIRILLVDAHPITLLGLSTLLSDNRNYEIVGSLNSASDVLKTVKLTQPDIVLMDLDLPKTDSFKLIQELQVTGEIAVKVVILAATLSETDTCDLIKYGVKGILLKEINASLIAQCIQRVHAGGEWLDRRSMRRAFEQILHRESEIQALSEHLSPRELSLAIVIAKGLCNKDAAKELKLTEGSVRVYLNRIYDKLNISNRLQLAMLVKNKGLV